MNYKSGGQREPAVMMRLSELVFTEEVLTRAIFASILFPLPGRNVQLNFPLGWEGANLSDRPLESEDAQGTLDVSDLHAEWSAPRMHQCLGDILYLIR